MSVMSLLPPLAVPKLKTQIHTPNLALGDRVLPNLLSLALAATLASPFPSHAIPSLSSQSPPLSLTTPFSQSKNLDLGLENGYVKLLHGLLSPMDWFHMLDKWINNTMVYYHRYSLSCRKIRPCPSINPGCISTNPKSSSFSFPWLIPENSLDDAIQVLTTVLYFHHLYFHFSCYGCLHLS